MISDSSDRGNTEMSAALKPSSAQPPMAMPGSHPTALTTARTSCPASSQVAS